LATYLLLLGYLGNNESLILLLVSLECLSWIFILIISLDLRFSYLIIQGYFFLWRLVFLIIGRFRGLLLTFLFKIGLPPFQRWMLHIFPSLDKRNFWFISSLHKILPIILLIWLFSGLLLLYLVVIIMVTAILLRFHRTSILFVIRFSSMSHTGWMLRISMLRIGALIKYILCYYILFFLFIAFLQGSWVTTAAFSQRRILRLTWLVMSGIPPFLIFWLKAKVIIGIILLDLLLRVLLLISVVILILIYYRVFSLNLINEKVSKEALRPALTTLSPLVL